MTNQDRLPDPQYNVSNKLLRTADKVEAQIFVNW